VIDSSARWRQLGVILDAALELEAERRMEYVIGACAGDRELEAEARAVLAGAEGASFLESPAAEFAAPLVDEDDGAEDASLEDAHVGSYRLVRELGRGGMGAVYLAERADGQFEQRVALKLLRRGTDSQDAQWRFLAERQILARLHHPHIAQLLDGGMDGDGRPYFAMEYVEGLPITTYCDQRRLGVDQRLRLFEDVCDAVRYAHQNLVVHRDLKPSNIFVTADGVTKLLDFGIAKLLHEDSGNQREHTLTGLRVMTPMYAAPEQVLGHPVTTVTDVYALGEVLYELLTGRRAHRIERYTPGEIERVICRTEPDAPSATVARPLRRRLKGDLDTIVLTALQKEPARRYPSAAALLEDLRRFRQGRPVLARPDSRAYRLRKFVNRHRGGAAVAAGIVVLLAAAGVRERSLRARAETQAQKATTVQRYLESVFNVANPYAPPDEHAGDVTARALLDRGAARIDSALAGQPEAQAELRGVLGRVYAGLGLYDTALALSRRSLEQLRALQGPRSPGVAAAMDQLGVVLRTQDRFDEAEPLLREALAQRRRGFGDHDTVTAESLDHLATLLQKRSDFAGAEPLFREALAIRRAVLGDSDFAVASSMGDLALLLYLKGVYDQAEPLYRQQLAIEERTIGENHPNTASTLHNLAQVEEKLGRYAQSEALYRRALAIKRKTLGDLHPSVTTNLHNLAELIERDDGRLGEAEALLREALELDRRIFGERHGYVAEDLGTLGLNLGRQGKLDEALRLMRQGLAINRTLYGAESDWIAQNLKSIASVLQLQGDLDGAIPLFRESRAQLGRLLGEKHPTYSVVSIDLALALLERGNTVEAERLLRTASTRLDPANPDQRGQLIRAQVGLGRTLTAEGRVEEARPVLERALELAVGQSGPEHLRTIEAQLALGECLIASRQYARAEPLVREAYTALQKRSRAQPRLLLRASLAMGRLTGLPATRSGPPAALRH
jgi:tetratricopeptide (TPR) repeat protein